MLSLHQTSASHQKLACGELRYGPPVKRRHKSSQILHFRYVKDTFLLPTINLCITEFDHFFIFSIWPWPVWFRCFRCECCFDSKQHRLHPRPPCLILIPKASINLCFVFKQLASLRKLKVTYDEI